VSDASAADGGHVLCALDDIPDPGGKGFTLAGRPPFFVVRTGDRVRGYLNTCPHQGTPLDWKPDTFLTYDKSLIQCSTHWAKFSIEDGQCVAGPCLGKSLGSIAVRIVGVNVVAEGWSERP
jgi:nitrite reductase/ring-hydroxylating ferredoxin subunit